MAASDPQRSHSSSKSRISRLVAVAVFGCGILLLFTLYIRAFSPPKWARSAPLKEDFDPAAIRQACSPDAVAGKRDAILAFGSRFLGQDGHRKTAAYIRHAYEQAGLEILTHDVRTVAPITIKREIRSVSADGSDGEPLRGVDVFPFFPNHLAPVTTGEQGVDGRLVLLDEKSLNEIKDFSDVVGVVDSAKGRFDGRLRFSWTRYAALGLKALIICNSRGLDAAPWEEIAAQRNAMVSSATVNFVRLAATEGILQHLGERVRLRVLTRFENVPNTIVYGVLRATQPAREALVLPAPFDAMSILPDRALGVMQAIGPALQLRLVEAMKPYQGQLTRDVVFMSYGSSVMANDGINHLSRILQANTQRGEENRLLAALSLKGSKLENKRLTHLRERATKDEAAHDIVRAVASAVLSPGFLLDPAATGAALSKLTAEQLSLFNEQFTRCLNEIVCERSEVLLQTRLKFMETGEENLSSPEFARYLAEKGVHDHAVAMSGFSAVSLLEQHPDYIKEAGLTQKLKERMNELLAYHEEVSTRIKQEIRIALLFDGYEKIHFFSTNLAPAHPGNSENETLTIEGARGSSAVSRAFFAVLNNVARAQGHANKQLGIDMPLASTGSHVGEMASVPFEMNSNTERWGYRSHLFFNRHRQKSYEHYMDPVDLPYMRNLETLRRTLAVAGESLLRIARGEYAFTHATVQEWLYFDEIGGRVLLSGVGQSVVPSYTLAGTVIGNPGSEGTEAHSYPGQYRHALVMTNPYGRFSLEFNSSDFMIRQRTMQRGYSPLAVSYADDGTIRYVKDEGVDGQRLFKSAQVSQWSSLRKNITIVCFRAEPVALFDLTNSQTMKDYTATRPIDAEGLSDFQRSLHLTCMGAEIHYLIPDERMNMLLQSGTPDNEQAVDTRAFMLGITDPLEEGYRSDVDGPGYLVADHPILTDVPFKVAASMAAVNHRRLLLQEHYHMADRQISDYQRKTVSLLKDAENPALPKIEATREARKAVAYATLDHPLIRSNLTEAVTGIIWYLTLLVPFSFFFEKLVFGYADVRRQIAAQSAIFLISFTLLRLLHPAFQMVRSSLMILLGVVIILISGSITLLFSSKFRENLADIRRKRGKVTGADINKLGVMGSAFMLGLNNMHRRKVRTGLTCATLTLLTFAMISFTSTNSQLRDKDIALGRAAYQGMMIKYDQFQPISGAEVSAYTDLYGKRFQVASRRFFRGSYDWGAQAVLGPEVNIATNAGNTIRTARVRGLLQLAHNEPLQKEFKFVGKGRWFTKEEETSADEMVPILLPESLAMRLGVSSEDVEKGVVSATVNGQRCRVIGILQEAAMESVQDLDGFSILPYDLSKGANFSITTRDEYMVPDDTPRLPPDQVIITPFRSFTVSHGVPVVASLVVGMPDASYREAGDAIRSHMEQTGQPIHFGLDNVAYRGERSRKTNVAGYVDLLIPLLIAGLTVLNTMKGSVYERRDEIFVYNAVGIAPRYVFFMFMAEALVYAVVGSVLGYFLSQGVGRILTILGWTGGLNMTFTSLSTIYASITIMLAVIISTWFPAKSAMEIAAPAEDSGWRLPEPDGDVLAFDLPFNFRMTGRMAVIAFFNRYLLDHAEGSAGRFFAGHPEPGIEDGAGGSYTPLLEATIWLKPFDLAVSQRLRILLPPDAETGQYKARIELHRLSGTSDAWIRLNRGFVAQLRRHFLHWRSVTAPERSEMFDEARELFEQRFPQLTPATANAGTQNA